MPRSEEIDWVAHFIEVACPDHHIRGRPDHKRARHAAMRILRRFPNIASDSFYTAIITGNLEAVQETLAVDPGAATRKSGITSAGRSGSGEEEDWFRELSPKGWEPILYLAFTRLPNAPASDNAVAIARLLLDNGADPNSYFMAGDSRYTPLVGVIGEGEENRPPHPHRDALARLFLERGANPYDVQFVYNLGLHGNVLWFLELIYEFSVKAGRKSDWDDPEWPMLDMGGYGSGAYWHLRVAIRNNDVELAEWILTHGGSPKAKPPTDPRMQNGTLLEQAEREGLDDIAALLRRRGAASVITDTSDEQRFLTAAMHLDRTAAMSVLERRPELLASSEAIIVAVRRDRADAVDFLLDLGVSPDVSNSQGERPLHIAAYGNSIESAKTLLSHGAEIDPVESLYGNTPLGGASYYEHTAMIELLAGRSNDIWQLVMNGKLARVRSLLEANPELAKTGWGGHTLLMWLPDDEDSAMEITRLLLDGGADASAKNSDGQTAADRASRRGMFEIADLLRRWSAHLEASKTSQ